MLEVAGWHSSEVITLQVIRYTCGGTRGIEV